MKQREFILCAAIKFGETIICGHRHGDCYLVLKNLLGEIPSDNLPNRDDQGFLTSLNRYVDRKEAWQIAKANNQIFYGFITDDKDSILISENLY